MKRLIHRSISITKREGIISLFMKQIKELTHVLLIPYFIFMSKIFYSSQADLNSLIHFAIKGCNNILEVSQEPKEIYTFLDFVKKKVESVNICMEIGTAKGGTLFLLSRIISQNGILISIDLPYGNFGGGYFCWRIPLYKSFVNWKQKMVLIRDNSHQDSVQNNVLKVLNNRKLDILFIDGDHSYEGVKQDFEDYSKFVRNYGLIAFHDITVQGMENDTDYGVHKFWNEIKNKYPYQEFCFNNGPGIGVIEYYL